MTRAISLGEVTQTEAKRMRRERKRHPGREQSMYRCHGEQPRYYSKCTGKAVEGSALGKGLSAAAGCDWMRKQNELIGSPQGSRQEKVYLEQGLLLNASTPPKGLTLISQTVKNLPTMQETQVQSLGREDPLEKGMVTHSSILA